MGKSIVILLFILTTAQAWGQITLQTEVSTKKSRWSGFTSMGYSSNFYEKTSPDAVGYGTAMLQTNYRVEGSNLIRASLSGFLEQNNGQEAKLNDGQIGWVNPKFWRTGSVLTVGQQVRAIVPTSKESRVRDEKLLGVTVQPTLSFNLTPAGLSGVSLIYLPQFTKNFHKTEQNKNFQNNQSFSTIQALVLAWSVTDRIFIQPIVAYGLAWSYDGYKKDDSFQFGTEIGYSFKSGIIVATGVNNSGTLQNFENGSDQRFEVYNNKTATAYMDLTYVF